MAGLATFFGRSRAAGKKGWNYDLNSISSVGPQWKFWGPPEDFVNFHFASLPNKSPILWMLCRKTRLELEMCKSSEDKWKKIQLTTSMLLSRDSCGWVPFKGSGPKPSVDWVRMVRGGIQIHSFGNYKDNWKSQQREKAPCKYQMPPPPLITWYLHGTLYIQEMLCNIKWK